MKIVDTNVMIGGSWDHMTLSYHTTIETVICVPQRLPPTEFTPSGKMPIEDYRVEGITVPADGGGFIKYVFLVHIEMTPEQAFKKILDYYAQTR